MTAPDPPTTSIQPQRTTRMRALAHVAEHPGATTEEVAEALGLTYAGAAYQLRSLVQIRFVKRRKSERLEGGSGALASRHNVTPSGRKALGLPEED